MTNQQLKELEDNLWASANALRAYGGLKASDYALPVLGLIFLRFADNKYSHYETEIMAEYLAQKGTRLERTIDKIALTKCGFYLPEYARFDYLLNLPGDQKLAKALQKAMEGIEEYLDEKYKDVLPQQAYFEIEKKEEDILPDLLKTFSDIPKDASGDIFGKIYEYFLGKFAMSEGQKGGEFFTPTSVVRFIVEVIEPYSGKIYDPACGSGGMFVQSAKFIQESKHDLSDIYVHGQEFVGQTARLAKMNLMVNNIRGEITETNSYQSDPYKSLGMFDFVMANPPFNVKSIKESTVKDDERFYRYGLPKNKGKNTDDSITDANYLWISLFATSLKETGRAGFVMPNSASDAGNSEYEIRKRIVDTGMVDCMVSMPSNMFFTVTLPGTLWFFDKNKITSDRKDKILFIDARNTYHQIDRAHREWKEENIQNLTAIVRLYRGENERFTELVDSYIEKALLTQPDIKTTFEDLQNKLQSTLASLKEYETITSLKRKVINLNLFPEQQKGIDNLLPKLERMTLEILSLPKNELFKILPISNQNQHLFTDQLNQYLQKLKELDNSLKLQKEALCEIWLYYDKNLKLKSDKFWTESNLINIPKVLEELTQNWKNALENMTYWQTNIDWLQSRFPDAKYNNVVGLCKLADRKEYAEEQDYSLNAGRYVGVEIEGDEVSKDEFLDNIIAKRELITELNLKDFNLSKAIEEQLTILINDLV